MNDSIDAILEYAWRDDAGRVVTAYLRRRERDVWDCLVVDLERQPLLFWVPGGNPEITGQVRREDGNTLMAVVSTPPGVSPKGLLIAPADDNGSPLGTLVSIVTQDGHTMLPRAREEDTPASAPLIGPNMLKVLLDTAASRKGNSFTVGTLHATDGGDTTVLLDWEGQPLMFWLDQPDGDSARSLMVAVILPQGGGIVAQALDELMRPQHSDLALADMLGSGTLD